MPAACALGIFSGKFILYFRDSGTPAGVPLSHFSREKIVFRSAALSQKAALQMPLAVTTPPVKMRLERSAERDKREIINNSFR